LRGGDHQIMIVAGADLHVPVREIEAEPGERVPELVVAASDHGMEIRRQFGRRRIDRRGAELMGAERKFKTS